jgi:hypothetical protein
MKTVILPNGKEVVQQRLPKEGYMRLRTTKVLNRKRTNNRQDKKKIIEQQLVEHEDAMREIDDEMRHYFNE